MKQGWSNKPLGQLCQLVSGQHIDSKDYNTDGLGIGYLTGPSDFGETRPIVTKWTEHPKVTATRGDILVTVKGSGVGKINVLDEQVVAISRQLMAIRVTGADPRFVYTVLLDALDHMRSLATGAAIPGISREQILTLEIPVPPPAEQRRIVSILDEAFEGIATAKANAERNVANARALFDSYLENVFTASDRGWPTKPLGDVCEFEGGSQPPKSEFIYSPKAGYVRFLQIRDFGSEKHVTYISESPKNRLCTVNDLMIGRYGASVGKILTGKSGAYNVALMKASPNAAELDREFFRNYLVSQAFQKRLENVASRSAQNGFGKDDIYQFPVPVPSLQEQRTTVGQLRPLSQQTLELVSLYEGKLAALDALRKSLLHRAFTGQL